MGFWSSVGSFFGGVARAVGSAVKGVFSVGKSIAGKVAEWLGFAKELKEAPQYDERSANLDETLKVNELLTDQRDKFSNSVKEIEKKLNDNLDRVQKSLLDIIDKLNSENDYGINKKFIENEMNNLKKSLDGSLGENISRRVQINDPECSKLLKLEGQEREDKIDAFIKKIIKSGIDKFLNDSLKRTNEMLSLAIDSIKKKSKEIDSDSKELKAKIELISNTDYDEKIKIKEELITDKEQLLEILTFVKEM